MDSQLRTAVDQALVSVRSFIEADGGGIEVVDIRGTVVYVRLSGMCKTCPLSQITLKAGVEQAIKERLPHVTAVQTVEE